MFETAASTPGVGELEEALRWGEPAYVTSQSKSGTAVRIAWKPASPTQYGMYFHCQTTLIEGFRSRFPNEFTYEGNRALIFEAGKPIPVEALKCCIAASLTYHRDKRRGAPP